MKLTVSLNKLALYIEYFFKTLKSELIYDNFWGNISRLRDKVDHHIRHFYNRIRLHSSLNYLSPI